MAEFYCEFLSSDDETDAWLPFACVQRKHEPWLILASSFGDLVPGARRANFPLTIRERYPFRVSRWYEMRAMRTDLVALRVVPSFQRRWNCVLELRTLSARGLRVPRRYKNEPLAELVLRGRLRERDDLFHLLPRNNGF